MSSVYGNWVSKDDARVRLDITTSTTADSMTITCRHYVENVYINTSNSSSTTTINGNSVNTSVRINHKGDNAIKMHYITVPRTHSAYSVSISGSTQFSYTGQTSSASTTVVVPAKDYWTVSYDAAGGLNAPSPQTKWYGETLTLQSSKPTRPLYDFVGWSVDDNESVEYEPSGSYTANQSVTLRAVWKLAWLMPEIYDVSCERQNGSQSSPATADISFKWKINQPGVTKGICVIESKTNNSNYVQIASYNLKTATGTFTHSYRNQFDQDKTYNIRITFSDGTQTVYAYKDLYPTFVPLEFAPGGTAACFGSHVPSDAQAGIYYHGFPLALKKDNKLMIGTKQGDFEELKPSLYRKEDWAGGSIILDFSNGHAVVTLRDVKTDNDTSWASKRTQAGLIPLEFRPKDNLQAPAICQNGGSWTSIVFVETDGAVGISNYGNKGSADSRTGQVCWNY